MKKWKQILGVALLIILGGVGGSIVTKAYFMRWFLVMGNSPQARTDFIMGRISKELKLRQDQETKIEGIVRQLEEERQGRKRQDFAMMMDEIKKELDSDQQKELEAFKKKYEKRKKKIGEDYLRQ
jgi:hypothetical protein